MTDTSIIPYNDPLMSYVASVDTWIDNTPNFERKGLRITFTNGLTLSAVRGRGNYADDNTFEIAVISDVLPSGAVELVYIPQWGDTVCGYQTIEQIRAFCWRLVSEGRFIP